MAQKESGYSATPLAKKLGLKNGMCVYVYQQPDHYFDLFQDFPTELYEAEQLDEESVDFIHSFHTQQADCFEAALKFKKALKKNGSLWISWPKGKSAIPTDLNRDVIRNYVLSIGLVDVKVAAVDEDWSGLKFVYRVEDRK